MHLTDANVGGTVLQAAPGPEVLLHVLLDRPRSGRARTYELGGACAPVVARGEQLMRVRFARPVVRALRKRVRRHRGVSVRVSATAHDAANNSASTHPKTIKLHA